MERSPSNMVPSINVHSFLDHSEYGNPIEGDDSLAKLFCFSNVRLCGPLATVNRIEAPGDALATGILLDEPTRE